MKSIGIREAFTQELKRKTIWSKDNPLYILVFIVVVFFMGTIGIWGEHAFVQSKRSLPMFVDSLTAINLTKYVAPILTAIVADWILKIFTQSKAEMPQGKKTFYVIVFILTLVAVGLMILGLSSPANKSSVSALLSTAIVLAIYYYSYCENPLYEDRANPKAVSASNVEVDPTILQGGGL